MLYFITLFQISSVGILVSDLSKKKLIVPHNKLRQRNPKFEYPRFKEVAGTEINTIVEFVLNPQYTKAFKKILSNYAIVLMVASIEFYVKHFARKLIDENKIDVSPFFEGDLNSYLVQKRTDLGRKVSAGHYFSIVFDFSNPKEINRLLSKMLRLDLFDTLKLLDADPDMEYSYFPRARRLHTNWENFIRMFEMRNDIVHGMRRYSVKPTQLRSLANNTYMFMENLSLFYTAYDPMRLGIKLRKNEDRILQQQKAAYHARQPTSTPSG